MFGHFYCRYFEYLYSIIIYNTLDNTKVLFYKNIIFGNTIEPYVIVQLCDLQSINALEAT